MADAQFPAIEGLTVPSKARVMLFQSGKQVHAPVTAIGLQPLDTTLTALAGLTAAAGLVSQTGVDSFAKRTLTGAANKVTVTNGDGKAGNPTISIPDAVTLVTPTITGLLTLSGGQIAFPATQVASADPNTLDDYEEGTWTVVVQGTTTAGTGTYTNQVARYTKIGRMVFFEFTVAWTAHTGTGNIQVTLPFTADSSPSPPCALTASSLTFSNQLSAQVAAGTATAELLTFGSGTNNQLVPMDTAATLRIAGCYVT